LKGDAMTEKEKWKAGQPFDSAKLWLEMDDEDTDIMLDEEQEDSERELTEDENEQPS
jgi:hypothetical protein